MNNGNAFWLLTVPNEGRTPEQTFDRTKGATDEFSKGYLVQIPSLTVGTLDSLMVHETTIPASWRLV